MLTILVGQSSTREKEKLRHHFSWNNFLFKGLVWTCLNLCNWKVNKKRTSPAFIECSADEILPSVFLTKKRFFLLKLVVITQCFSFNFIQPTFAVSKVQSRSKFSIFCHSYIQKPTHETFHVILLHNEVKFVLRTKDAYSKGQSFLQINSVRPPPHSIRLTK